jgi:ParB family chromosome partitioning protein
VSKRALGRGIDALLPGQREGLERPAGTTTVALSELRAGSQQPRRSFPQEPLEELARSIRQKGLLQPLLVEEAGEGSYAIVAGERRFRAAQLAGLQEVPVIVRQFSELEKTEIALIENLQREDLTPVEEALGYKALIDKGKLTQEDVAVRVGKNRSTVANALRLLKLPEPMLAALDEGRLTPGHARALLSVTDSRRQEALFRQVLEAELSVRETERRAATPPAPRPGPVAGRAASPRGSAELKALEQRFIERFGTKVSIRGTDSRGRIEIAYFSADDLERIIGLLGGA